MKLLQTLKDRIKQLERNMQKLHEEKEEFIKRIEIIDSEIIEYQEEMNEMKIAIEKLEN